MKKTTFAQDFHETDKDYYEAFTIVGSSDAASKLATKLAKRHNLDRRRFALYRVSGDDHTDAYCNRAGWHVTYNARAVVMPPSEQEQILDPRQCLQYNIRYTKNDVIESWPSDGKDGYTVELVRLNDYFFQVCEVRDVEPSLFYHGSYFILEEARSIAHDVAMGTQIGDFEKWVARQTGKLATKA